MGLSAPLALAATGLFLIVDAVLVASCALKFLQGGWFPLAMGGAIFAVMATWRRGRQLLLEHTRQDDPDLLPFITALAADEHLRQTPRTAVFAVANPDTVPQALLHNLKHNQVLHEQNVILSVRFHEVPWIPERNACRSSRWCTASGRSRQLRLQGRARHPTRAWPFAWARA